MTGITAYGAWIPRLRLDRMAVFQAMGWFAPATIMVAQGERSICNHDEDSLTMAVAAARDCLTGIDKTRISGSYLCSTTLPFSDRQNAGILATALNLDQNLMTADFSSCLRAGTTGLISALEAVAADAGKNILVTACDQRDAKPGSFYELWFGDGAGSLLVGGDRVIAEFLGSHSIFCDFVDHYRGASHRFDYIWEERWAREEGYGKLIPAAVQGLLGKLGLSMSQVSKLAYPCLFKAEHRAIAKAMGAGQEQLIDNLHEVCGETGAAHPLLMLIAALEKAKPGELILVAGFGQGCDALLFRVTENITLLPERRGMAGSLANRKTTENYLKYLKFRGLIDPETGIRAEAPTQTAMTALWRNRKMILGLVGGKCRQCGTAQFPKMDICVDPTCGAVHSQDDYEFAGLPAKVKTFTGDMLAVSADPPAIYGMIQFDDGGRFMADFTDCEPADVKVGAPVIMSFRRRYVDAERGFSGYFWKAIPQPWKEPERGIRFDGQVAVITGAGGGLGRAYALELARRGAKVLVNDFGGRRDGSGEGSARPADAVVAEITALGGIARANYDSVTTPEGGERIIKAAGELFGRIDILINNAGILLDKSFAKMDRESWRTVLDVHLNGAFNVTQPAFRMMREQGYGRIVLTTSAAGLYGNFGQTNYAAAKMGLLGFMNSLKLEGRKYNVLVNTVAPLAASRLTEDVMPPEVFRKMAPEFVVPLTLFFCSRECRDSGMIINASAGYFSRAAVMTSPGIQLGDRRTPPTPEDIRDNFDRIDALQAPTEMTEATAAVMALLSGPAPVQEPTATTGEASLDVPGVFRKLPEVFNAQAATGKDLIFQFHISGPAGGDWAVTIKDGTCRVDQGTAPKATTVIRMADKDFLELITGRLDGMRAFAAGKLKVEGEVTKAQLIGKLFTFKTG